MVTKCPFCAIAKHEANADVVHEDDHTIAFLDIRPLFPGHVLCIPKEHHVTLADLPIELVAPLFTTARTMASAVERALEAQGTFVAMNNKVSQSVPHLHVHVVPRTKGDGLKGFFWPRHKYESDEARSSIAEKIRNALSVR
ncbi:MAG: HIT family protein [Polyangiales bacterium]